jgi:hypothetical protein
MPTGLKRFQQIQKFYFITFSCYCRQPFLATDQNQPTVLNSSRASATIR